MAAKPRRRKLRPYHRQQRRRRPRLRFTVDAWAKLVYLRDKGRTEVGGFGISAADDPLLVTDVRLVKQVCTAVTVAFDDAAVADFFDESVDAGLPPERFARLWIHTHPGACPQPSPTDEKTFERAFGGCDWAVMAILARGGESYARLRFAAGPGGELVIPVEVDFRAPFDAADVAAWDAEYTRCVTEELDFFGPNAVRRIPVNGSISGAADHVAPRMLEIDDRDPDFRLFTDDPYLWEFPDELCFLNEP